MVAPAAPASGSSGTSGGVGGWGATTSSQWTQPPGALPPNTSTARTLGSWSRTEATSGACSASTITRVASELSITYCISAALNRYDTGTEVSPTFRLAWNVVITASELGPHHATRSPRRPPRSSSARAKRLASASSSAKVVADGCAPPAASTMTAA